LTKHGIVGVPHTDIGIPNFSAQELEEFNKQEVHLGPMPMDPEFLDDVEKTIKEHDEIHQRQIEGENQANGIMEPIHSLYQEFQNKIKRGQSLDAPDRMSIPLPLQYVFVQIDYNETYYNTAMNLFI